MLEARFGVPLLAIPITNDQPGVAARIAHKNVGLVISQDNLSSSDLPALIDDTGRARNGNTEIGPPGAASGCEDCSGGIQIVGAWPYIATKASNMTDSCSEPLGTTCHEWESYASHPAKFLRALHG